EKGIARRSFTAEEIQWQALATMMIEAALLQAEGIAAHFSDVDVVFVNGYGFPAQKGGPLFWARRRPREQVSRALEALAAATGYAFKRGDVEGVLDKLQKK